MARWLMKSEPETFSWEDLVRDGSTQWDGVRNYAARQHLNAMQPGDEAFFYHSGKGPAVVGIMRVTGPAVPDGDGVSPEQAWNRDRALAPTTARYLR